jgi:hypothetical protein
MIKKAGLEESSVTDPQTGLKVRVSTTARMKYRKFLKESSYSEKNISNIVLNDIIANDFYNSSSNVLHYFIANSSSLSDQKKEWVEIRKMSNNRGSLSLFFSILREGSIDIITISQDWRQPKKARTKAG